jgi:hypothetical protein
MDNGLQNKERRWYRGVLNLKTHNEALLLKNLHKFYNKINIPYVDMV